VTRDNVPPTARTPLHYGGHRIEPEDIAAVVAALESPRLTQGPLVQEFERQLSEATDAAHVSVCSNGTAALHLAYAALGLGPGDEIITSPITFVATANAARMLGAEVRFADVLPRSGNLDPESVARLIGPKTRGIVPVHFAGLPADLKALRELADRHGLWIVDDAAHALGAEYRGSKLGSGQYTEATTFSFHPVKHITTGEGGAVCTRDPGLKQRIDRLREHGLDRTPAPDSEGNWGYVLDTLGYNYRLTDVQCALGCSQLKRLDSWLAHRERLAACYREHITGFGLPWLSASDSGTDCRHAYHLFPALLDFERVGVSRGRLISGLKAQGIHCMVHYMPVCDQPYYERRYGRSDCAVARRFYAQELSLPMHVSLTETDVLRVVTAIDQTVANAERDRRGGNPWSP
jgi:perosamine synthetase